MKIHTWFIFWIFPRANSHIYFKYFYAGIPYYDKLLDAWEHHYGNNRSKGIKKLRKYCNKAVHLWKYTHDLYFEYFQEQILIFISNTSMPEYLTMTNFWTLGNTTMEKIEAKALKNLENIVIKLFIVKIHTNLYFD